MQLHLLTRAEYHVGHAFISEPCVVQHCEGFIGGLKAQTAASQSRIQGLRPVLRSSIFRSYALQ
ncbi:hypothetical protein I7I53_07751 [Histoplasma capsulatum var. duboisii H88]|uniref:Uncharacterized protein n=1 Tax=Ajellomyces capsulatus (strain H88) TaxID=544711 RepID=A0A8A1LED6_AJEC8|nr:hypothetical protein I7I53_07751 [Histoplasma capsulatum var. duboisii H88]